MRDAQTLLLHALRSGAPPAPPLRVAHSEAWASATFAGARHSLTFAATEAKRADAFAAAIGEREFSLPGHLVADIAIATRTVAADGVSLTIEALTVEDA